MTAGAPRLAYVCADPGIAPDADKGAAVHFRELARALRGAGAAVDAYLARGGAHDRDAFDRLHIVAPERAAGIGHELALAASSAAVRRALAAGGPHDAVYERLSLFSLGGMAHARALGAPFIVEVNAPLWEEAERYRSLHLRRSARAMALDVLEAADSVCVVSRALAEQIVGEGVAAAKVRVVANGVNRRAFEQARAADKPPALRGKATLVFIGSLKPWHGIELLLDGFERCRRRLPVGLWVIGDGPLRELVARAAAAHPGAIVAQGAVRHEEVPAILKAADAAVAPYPADAPPYFCPLKIVEALALGVPLVASDTRCVRDVVGEGDAVELFDPRDVQAFVAAVERAIARPRAAARASIDERWCWEAKARALLGWLAECRRRPAIAAGGG